MQKNTIKDIIKTARGYAQQCESLPEYVIKSAFEDLANRLERLSYVTQNEIIMEALCPKDAPKIDSVFAKPPLEGFAKFLAVPALGMLFRRYKSANMTKLVASWRDEANSHVYEITVEPICDSPGWCATATNDGHVVFQLRTKNRTNCEHFALSAMKRYLKRGHRRTYRTIAKAKGGK
jgi:hypothetical protein